MGRQRRAATTITGVIDPAYLSAAQLQGPLP